MIQKIIILIISTTDYIDLNSYWLNLSYWDYNRLNNKLYSYNNNLDGSQNCTLFSNNWNRFLIQLDISNIYNLKNIITYIENMEGRNQKEIHYYYTNDYNKTININNRDNTNLKELGNVILTSYISMINTIEYNINVIFNKYFIQDNDNICKSDDGIQLITSDTLPYIIDKFNTYGMNDLSNINETVISKINNNKYNIAMLKSR